MDRVVILGKKGSFHQEAAINYFKEHIITVSAHSFIELADYLEKNNDIKYGVLAIENSIAGTILQNYRILRERQFRIVGEKYLPIHHNLIGVKGTKMKDIKEVISHPMAIYQCRNFFNTLANIKFTETTDTASAVEKVALINNKSTVAIGSHLASKIYDLELINNNIAAQNINITRFFIIAKNRKETAVKGADKASLFLRTTHQKGSLLKVLLPIKNLDLNLSKLQSYPVPGEINKYYFHLDLEFDSIKQFWTVVDELSKVTQELKVLGIYKRDILVS
jgi:prephenate dehydratase